MAVHVTCTLCKSCVPWTSVVLESGLLGGRTASEREHCFNVGDSEDRASRFTALKLPAA